MKPSAIPTAPEEYSRKSKSLGLLCENFCKRDWGLEHDNMISIDEAAKSLGVERRRIYDIINILESLDIVQRKCKNAYHWLGFGRLPSVLAEIQKEGIEALPEEAARLLGGAASDEEEGDDAPQVVESSNESTDSANYVAKKSLGRLSRQFLQLFLVGHSVMSLTDASDRIMGKVDVSSHKEELRKAAYVKAQKTKIRRLYDIANVLASIGLVQKTDGERRSRPTFAWIYHWSPQQIRELTKEECGVAQTPVTGYRVDGSEPSPAGVGELVDNSTSSSPHDGTKVFLSRIHEHGGACEAHATTSQLASSSHN
jgi:transcription factor E2F7/8